MSDPQHPPGDPGQPYGQPPPGPGQPPYNQPPPAPPYGAGPGYQAPVEDPGKTLGIIGLVLSFFTALIGLIISAVALRKSKKAGFKNTPALIGVIIGAIGTAIAIIALIVAGIVLASVADKCAELGPGVHREGNTVINCG